MIDVVENCGLKRKSVKGFLMQCDKCGSQEVEIINHRDCNMSAACNMKSIEIHCLGCDGTAILIE